MKLKAPEAVSYTPEKLKKAGPKEIADHLERGRLVMFPEAPMPLPSGEDIVFLRDMTPRLHSRKSISYYPQAGKLNGMRGSSELRSRCRRILKEHHERVETFLRGVIPTLCPGWTTATSSLRAFEERNRHIPIRQRSDLLHLDAGTYGATHGDLILRFFVNLDDQDRVWRVKGTVGDLVEKYGERAGLRRDRNLVREGVLDRLYSGIVSAMSRIAPMANSADQSPYDRAMRKMHNYMKESGAFQADPEGATEVRFKPRSGWMVFADMAGHACTQGRFTIIDTFIVHRDNFGNRDFAPFEVLKRYCDRGATAPAESPSPA